MPRVIEECMFYNNAGEIGEITNEMLSTCFSFSHFLYLPKTNVFGDILQLSCVRPSMCPSVCLCPCVRLCSKILVSVKALAGILSHI